MEVKQTTVKHKVGDGTPGPGRPKGSQNKLTSDVKAMILAALNDAGGAQYLLTQARDNPNAFLTLVGKVLPMTVQGDKDNPLAVVTRIELVGMAEHVNSAN